MSNKLKPTVLKQLRCYRQGWVMGINERQRGRSPSSVLGVSPVFQSVTTPCYSRRFLKTSVKHLVVEEWNRIDEMCSDFRGVSGYFSFLASTSTLRYRYLRMFTRVTSYHFTESTEFVLIFYYSTRPSLGELWNSPLTVDTKQ